VPECSNESDGKLECDMKIIQPNKSMEPNIDIDEQIPCLNEEPPVLPENEGDSSYINWLNDIMRKTDMAQNNTEFVESARYELADN
jgi:hypothetical protein